MKSHEYPTKCPFCGKENDLTTATKPERLRPPRDGDFSLCIACGDLGIFDDSHIGGMRKPTEAEYEKLERSENVRQVRKAWLMLKRKRDRDALPKAENLGQAFENAMTSLYGGTSLSILISSPAIKREFRRMFFAGAATVTKLLADAHDDETSDSLVIGTAFTDVIAELHSYQQRLDQGDA